MRYFSIDGDSRARPFFQKKFQKMSPFTNHAQSQDINFILSSLRGGRQQQRREREPYPREYVDEPTLRAFCSLIRETRKKLARTRSIYEIKRN